MKTEQDVKDYVAKRREVLYDDDIAIVIEDMLERKEITSDIYYFAMEYLDEDMQKDIDVQELHDMNKEMD